MRRLVLLVVGSLALAGVGVASSGGATQAQPHWVITDLGTLQGASGVSGATAINDRGQVVGWSSARNGGAFLWERGEMHNLGTFRKLDSEAYDINSRGQIVGSCYRLDDNEREANWHALLWENGRMHLLAVPKRHGGAALAINDTGDIVGWEDELDEGGVGEPFGSQQAVLWQKGKMRTLGTVGGDHNSQATGINNRTQVVGNSGSMDSNEYMFDLTGFLWRDGAMQSLGRLRDQDDGIGAINDKGQIVGSRGGHATVWEDGTPRDLATTRAESSSANDINNRGQIVGSWWARRNPGRSRAALWENKKPALLPNLPGGKNSGASAINEHGQIVGWAETKGGSTHAVLWTQKP